MSRWRISLRRSSQHVERKVWLMTLAGYGLDSKAGMRPCLGCAENWVGGQDDWGRGGPKQAGEQDDRPRAHIGRACPRCVKGVRLRPTVEMTTAVDAPLLCPGGVRAGKGARGDRRGVLRILGFLEGHAGRSRLAPRASSCCCKKTMTMSSHVVVTRSSVRPAGGRRECGVSKLCYLAFLFMGEEAGRWVKGGGDTHAWAAHLRVSSAQVPHLPT